MADQDADQRPRVIHSDTPPIVKVEHGPVVRHDDEVFRVTSAKTSLTENQRMRIRRYLISMGIRTACFLAVIVTSGPIRWAFFAGALFLPYIAVVMANAGRENDDFPGPEAVDPRTGTQQIPAEPRADDPAS